VKKDSMKAIKNARDFFLFICLILPIELLLVGFPIESSIAQDTAALRPGGCESLGGQGISEGKCSSNVCVSPKYPNLIVDGRIQDNAEAFLDQVVNEYHLILNSSFRTHQEQQSLREKYLRSLAEWKKNGSPPGHEPTPAAPAGQSRHESGLAIDLGGLKRLGFNDWNNVLNLAKKYGFKYLLGDWPEEGNEKFDWPHFQAEPERFGLTTQEAIMQNSDINFNDIPQCAHSLDWPPTTDGWLRFYYKLSSGVQPRPSERYIEIGNDSNNPFPYLQIIMGPSKQTFLNLQQTNDSLYLTQNVAGMALVEGQWTCIEVHVASGLIEMFMNGVLTLRFSGRFALDGHYFNRTTIYQQRGGVGRDVAFRKTRIGCSNGSTEDSTPPSTPSGSIIR
jgi:hypothetical protein